MKTTDGIDDAIARVLESTTANFVELTKVAGLDPASDFRGANLSDIDFSGSNLAGFDFTGASFIGATFVNAKIGGAKFTRSAQLDSQLRGAIDANEVFQADADRFPLHRRRRRRHGPRQPAGNKLGDTKGKYIDAPQDNQKEESSYIPSVRLGPEVFEASPDRFPLHRRRRRRHGPGQLGGNESSETKKKYIDARQETREEESSYVPSFRLRPVAPDKEVIAPSVSKGADITRVLLWIDENPSHSAVSGHLMSLIRQVGLDESVKQRALRWIDQHPTSRTNVDVLIALLRSGRELDSRIKQRTFRWLKGNWNWPHAAVVLGHLARHRSDQGVRKYVAKWNIENSSHAILLSTFARSIISGK